MLYCIKLSYNIIDVRATEYHSPQENPDSDFSLYKVIPHPMKPYLMWRSCVAILWDKWRNSKIGSWELDQIQPFYGQGGRKREREGWMDGWMDGGRYEEGNGEILEGEGGESTISIYQ